MRCVISEVTTDVEVDYNIGNLSSLFSISSVSVFFYAPSEFIDAEMMKDTRPTALSDYVTRKLLF